MSTVAIIVAAGKGNRAGGKVAKQWRTIAGKLVVDWSIDAFKNHDLVEVFYMAVEVYQRCSACRR